MRQILLWQVTDDGPTRLTRGGIDLERHLEDWIERDPGLLQTGLTILGRQVSVEAGALDLLALDPQGRWVVIEIKRGAVRRETVAQALDYAACVATMPYHELSQRLGDYLRQHDTSLEALLEERAAEEDADSDERDVTMYLVGTGKDPSLDRMVEYLSAFEVPINVVSYDVFQLEGGQQVLVRELTEAEAKPPSRARVSVEQISRMADRAGIGERFRKILESSQRHDLFPRAYKQSIMYTPPSNRARMLFTVWAWTRADGSLRVYVGPEAFAEFYPVTADQVASLLGPDGLYWMGDSAVDQFVANLDRLFEIIAREEEESEE